MAASQDPLHESFLQRTACDWLTSLGGYREGASGEIDRSTALLTGDLLDFIRDTQPEVWQWALDQPDGTDTLVNAVLEWRNEVGTVELLQSGVPAALGRPHITMLFPVPFSTRNDDAEGLFQTNRFTIVNEVYYEARSGPRNRIDAMTFVNGIALWAAEYKNETTYSSLAAAEQQWKTDRDPTEPLLRPFTGCAVYFAVSNFEASFTTELAGRDTVFRPFNAQELSEDEDLDTDENGYTTHHLWQKVWPSRALTDLIVNFLHTVNRLDGHKVVVMPRYHQWDLINRVMTDLHKGEAPYRRGGSFLIQHSPGSGKTLEIAYLAHAANRLHDGPTPMFDAVIVVTDRKVVDQQLQDAISTMTKNKGLVACITQNSSELAYHLARGTRIIVTTVQKFSYIAEELTAAGKIFAVIIDEAHSGQTGERAAVLRQTIDKGDETRSTLDELLDSGQLKPQANITYFAFTATPRDETLQRFAHGVGKPYHTYTMNQAIKEGYILDVLQQYRKVDVRASAQYVGDDKTDLVETQRGLQRLSSYVRKDAGVMEAKARMTLDHMARVTLLSLEGQGRGMLVVSSREEALLMYRLIEELIETTPLFASVRPVVAYSGSLTENGKSVTDADINGFPESEIPARMKQDRNLLIVAEKFQTGYDEPLMCSMYLDRGVAGITAVQTLSRLNRIHPGKETVYVLDFADNEERIAAAFGAYQSVSEFLSTQDANVETLHRLTPSVLGVLFTEQDARLFGNAVRARKSDITDLDAAKDYRDVTMRVKSKIRKYEEMSYDSDERAILRIWRSDAKRYLRNYIFVSQFHTIQDQVLQDLYRLTKHTLKSLTSPHTETEEWLDDIDVHVLGVDIFDRTVEADLAGDVTSGGERDSNASTSAQTDEARTVPEIVALYNRRVASYLIRHINGWSVEESGDTQEAVMTAIAEAAAADTALISLAAGQPLTQLSALDDAGLVNRLVLLAFGKMRKTLQGEDRDRVKAFTEAYSKDGGEVKAAIHEFVLRVAYQVANASTPGEGSATDGQLFASAPKNGQISLFEE